MREKGMSLSEVSMTRGRSTLKGNKSVKGRRILKKRHQKKLRQYGKAALKEGL